VAPRARGCTPAQPPPLGEVADMRWPSHSTTCTVQRPSMLLARRPPCPPSGPSPGRLRPPGVPILPAQCSVGPRGTHVVRWSATRLAAGGVSCGCSSDCVACRSAAPHPVPGQQARLSQGFRRMCRFTRGVEVVYVVHLPLLQRVVQLHLCDATLRTPSLHHVASPPDL
jgi:hypothetical protein